VAVAVVVFTRDLRVEDNPALVAAAAAEHVVPLFVLDDGALGGWHRAPNRLGFLVESLHDLDAALRARGGALLVRRGDWVGTVVDVVRAHAATEVHVADDVSGYARGRLDRLRRAARDERVAVVVHPGVTVVPPGAIVPSGRDAFLVFTPYYRAWRAVAWRRPMRPPPRISPPPSFIAPPLPRLEELTGASRAPDVIPGGERAAIARLRAWADRHLEGYAERGDRLDDPDGSSHISPYLHFGCLSPLQVATRLRERPGADPFVRQLCWRDFHHQVLAARPSTAHEDLRPANVEWEHDDNAFAAWCAGRTGYPLVDAGMRQLTREGWMHNRARLTVASFLTKHLSIDWRAGADHFMAHLVDGDVANNQLNWQWVAGTGTDPNAHRMFNPARQAARFDPDGAYVARYVTELSSLDPKVARDPDPAARRATGYPDPLVDHATAYAAFRARPRH
jgi:deoxyribodipyrimidine photo-lyase